MRQPIEELIHALNLMIEPEIKESITQRIKNRSTRRSHEASNRRTETRAQPDD